MSTSNNAPLEYFPSLVVDKALSRVTADTELSPHNAILKQIQMCLYGFCECGFYHSARMISYDQSVGLYVKSSSGDYPELYQLALWCRGDFTVSTRGCIVYSPENRRIANCSNLEFMMLNSMIPLRFISELNPITDEKYTTEYDGDFYKSRIFKVKRSSGVIHNCIIGRDGCIYRKTNSDTNSGWRLKVHFNSEGEYSDDINKLERGSTNVEKTVYLEEFLEMNDIHTITVDVGTIKKCVSTDGYKESDLELDENSEQAIYNGNGDVNEYYRDNREIVQKDILSRYFEQIDSYFSTIDNTFGDGIIFKIV